MNPEVEEVLEQSEALLLEGLDEAVIGYVEGFGQQPVALYDKEKILQILIERDGMSEEAALDFFGYNIQGAYVGPGTPAFATLRPTKP